MAKKLLVLTFVVAFGALLSGCPSVGVYRTARTLDPGVSDLGFTYSASRISNGSTTYTDSDGIKKETDALSVTIPNLIPDVSYHIGIIDDLEIGGRIGLGSGLIELDAKYRILQAADNKLHLSVQPAIGYRALFLVEGVNITLPVMVTYDVNRWFAVTAFGYGSYYNLEETDSDFDVGLGTNSFSAGGGAGFEFRGETFYVMPFVDVARTLTSFEAEGSGMDFDITWVNFGVSFGFHLGKEKKQLDRIEKKLDRIDSKL